MKIKWKKFVDFLKLYHLVQKIENGLWAISYTINTRLALTILG